jgi:hypothetical protein
LLLNIGFFGALKIIQAMGVAIGAAAFHMRKMLPTTRSGAILFGGAWVLVATMEFWVFGPWSFIAISNELDYGPPLYRYLNDWHGTGIYSHAYAGGNDIYGMNATGGQYISLERLFLQAFPLWIAHGIQKIIAVALSFAGIYKISRSFKDIDRSLAAALAAFYTLTYEFIINTTWFSGFGYAIIPLAVYFVVLRAGDKKLYLAGVTAIAFIQTISTDPFHSVLVLLFCIALVGLYLKAKYFAQICFAIVIIVIALLLNWHEVLYGVATISPTTQRFNLGANSDFTDIFSLVHMAGQTSILIIAAVALASSAAVNYRVAGKQVVFFLLALLTGVFLANIPWDQIGLKLVAGLNFRYLESSVALVTTILLLDGAKNFIQAQRIGSISLGKKVRLRHFSLLIIALAIGQLCWYKAYNASVWLSEGGLANVPPNAAHLGLSTSPNPPYRVVSVPYRLPPNIAPALGLHAFDGLVNLAPVSAQQYWTFGVNRIPGSKDPNKTDYGVSSQLNQNSIDSKCCSYYEFTKYADIDLLRIANVKYILSVLPLVGESLIQVSGPRGPSPVPRRTSGIMARINGYLDLNFKKAPVRVYEIPDPLPRVFGAAETIFVERNLSVIKFIEMVAANADRKVAILREGILKNPSARFANLKVEDYRLVEDGFDINVDAPNGGLLIINVPHNPFWVASADRADIKTFPANLIHTGTVVPAGAKSIKIRYKRALLSEKIVALYDKP